MIKFISFEQWIKQNPDIWQRVSIGKLTDDEEKLHMECKRCDGNGYLDEEETLDCTDG